MVIKEKKVNIMTVNDREVIIQIIEIIMQEYHGSLCHIMSDNIMSIYFKRCIIASEFIMDIDIYIMSNYVQVSFTKELIIQLKIILEKFTPFGFDITLLIKNCGRVQYIYISQSINLVNIIRKRHHIKYLEENSYNIIEKSIKRSHLGVHLDLKKDIIKFDIITDILDFPGHLAQRGHQSPSDMELDIFDSKWHLAINIEYHLLDFSSISRPNYLSITSVINLDIIIKADGFRVIRLSYIHQFNMLDIIVRTEQTINVINIDYHMLEYSSISGPNYITVTEVINLDIMVKVDRFIRTVCPSSINLLNNQNTVIKTEGFIKTIIVEPYPLCISDISQADYILMTSGFRVDTVVRAERFIRLPQPSSTYLLNNLDIDIKVERFIRTFHLSYIHLIKGINGQAPSGDHQQTLKSHRGASSMNTSVEHIIYVHDIMVKQTGLVQTFCIYVIIFNVFFSEYSINNELIIDNYLHIIISALLQWEALDITHTCPSRSGASKSHHIEWRDSVINIIDSNFFKEHLIEWDELSY